MTAICEPSVAPVVAASLRPRRCPACGLALALSCASLASLPLWAAENAANLSDGRNVSAEEGPELASIELEEVEVHGSERKDYTAKYTATATKVDTPLRYVPQAISVVTSAQIRDQAIQGMAEAVRYVPGVGFAQGEGNRDTAIFRGSSSTGDFYVDGVRDDTQYFRDLYNIERVEVLKGPNAMIFGRGGSGGVINRVTKAPGWRDSQAIAVTLGSWNDHRFAADLDRRFGERVAFRVTGVYEEADSFRQGYELERWGVNPTLSFRLGENTLLTVGYEHFRDERTSDRGQPSFQGRPLPVDRRVFFGNAELSPNHAEVDAFNLALDHEFANGVQLRNRTRWASYAKFYQNVYPGAVDASGTEVSVSAYNSSADRDNLFNQTDLVFRFDAGGWSHEFLAGAELGRQDTDNFRNTGYFVGVGPDVTSVRVPVDNPYTPGPVEFRQKPGDADNRSRARLAAFYVQDQVELTPTLRAILGLRKDRFDVELLNHRDGSRLDAVDTPLSPRAGLVYTPRDELSFYASYSVAYVPRAGDQLASLTVSNEALDPEKFRNLEVGAKWDIRSDLAATLALYQLDRSNVAVPDPLEPTRSILVDGQRTRGLEASLSGHLTEHWQVIGGYAWQDGEITRTLSASAPAGASLAQLPEHSFSLWNRYDFSPRWGVGLGLLARSAMYASTDNSVVLPGYARVDAAVYWTVDENLRLQLNVENLLDREYYANAHNNNNISPGSPRAVRLGLNWRF